MVPRVPRASHYLTPLRTSNRKISQLIRRRARQRRNTRRVQHNGTEEYKTSPTHTVKMLGLEKIHLRQKKKYQHENFKATNTPLPKLKNIIISVYDKDHKPREESEDPDKDWSKNIAVMRAEAITSLHIRTSIKESQAGTKRPHPEINVRVANLPNQVQDLRNITNDASKRSNKIKVWNKIINTSSKLTQSRSRSP